MEITPADRQRQRKGHVPVQGHGDKRPLKSTQSFSRSKRQVFSNDTEQLTPGSDIRVSLRLLPFLEIRFRFWKYPRQSYFHRLQDISKRHNLLTDKLL